MRALQIALGIACLAVVYAGLAPVLKAGSISATRLPPIEAPPARDASPERYAVIGVRNLFRTREAGPITPVEEDLKESQLQLKLCGTYAAQPIDRSVACIEDQGKRRAFRVGQDISQGVRLLSVERRRAVIDNRGAREQLSMEETPSSTIPVPGGRVSPTAQTRVNPRSTPRLSDRLKELRDRTPPEAAQPSGDVLRPKLQAALEGAQIAPVYDESGQFGGVKLTNIRAAGPFAGLAENTVCFELNGAKLDGVQTLPQALMSSSTGQACLRCRQPDGVETMRCL